MIFMFFRSPDHWRVYLFMSTSHDCVKHKAPQILHFTKTVQLDLYTACTCICVYIHPPTRCFDDSPNGYYFWSLCLSISLFFFSLIFSSSLFLFPSVSFFLFPSCSLVCLSVCLSVGLSVFLSVYLSVGLSVLLSVRLSTCPAVSVADCRVPIAYCLFFNYCLLSYACTNKEP